MTTIYAFHLVCALLAGALIGVERSYHGRAAGMRTYALVCLGSTLVVIAAIYPAAPGGSADPGASRVIQGIVTGIGFLGAGVIVNEGLSVRGLTTAASIWVTAGIGILIGVGSWALAALATVLTLGTLSVFRRIEDRMPTQSWLHCYIRFPAADTIDEEGLRALLGTLGFRIAELSYRLHGEPKIFEYRLVLWSSDPAAGRKLAELLKQQKAVAEFRISPSKD
jgi:putative Mg2+ transporter-C (MgtC) family protein